MDGRPTANIFSVLNCLIEDARSVNSKEMAWGLFIMSGMISNIVHDTNQKIERISTHIT